MNKLELHAMGESLKRKIREGLFNRYMKSKTINESEELSTNDTHFAIYKPQNKIVFSWDYSGIDSAELRRSPRYYFTGDLIDNSIQPEEVKILNRNACIRMGIDPAKRENWTNGPSDEGWNIK